VRGDEGEWVRGDEWRGREVAVEKNGFGFGG